LVSGDAGQIVRAYNQGHARAGVAPPVQSEIRLWYNPGLSSKK
jgi:hypothetical protein